MRLSREKSLLLIVDLQAGLLPVIEHGDQAVTEAAWLGALAGALAVPVWVTEQYPQGLGAASPACWRRCRSIASGRSVTSGPTTSRPSPRRWPKAAGVRWCCAAPRRISA